MNKLRMVIRELHRSESDLGHDLMGMSDRYASDHEIYHLARDLSRWSQEHVTQLAETGRRYDLNLDRDVDGKPGLLATVQQKTAKLLRRRPEPALLLLIELRKLYRDASGVSLDWELLGQAAQAAKDRQLLALAQRCHPETLRQARWANAKLKELSPQALVS
ncbi:hypothetical protein ABZ570_07900 [Micromonospora sp. NPDC007271]|uniref:hypothetical protein n=1 Tax=Micromonospora sp. NPDC007271 TaxID=3154587 RepID=UPI0033C5528E